MDVPRFTAPPSRCLPPELWQEVLRYAKPEDPLELRFEHGSEPDLVTAAGRVSWAIGQAARRGRPVWLILIEYPHEQISTLFASGVLPPGCVESVYIRGGTLTCADAVRDIPQVSLVCCAQLRDISALGAQQYVDIAGCSVANISSLASVDEVSLYDCAEVASVRALGGQSRLRIGNCSGIADFSSLARVRELSISNCDGLVKLFAAENESLSLHDCERLVDIGELKSVGDLTILGSPDLAVGLEALKNVCACVAIQGPVDLAVLRAPVIRLFDNPTRDLTPLRAAHTVHLYDCPNIADVAPLASAREVVLYDCASIRDLSALRHVRWLKLSNINADTTCLGGAYHLEILNWRSRLDTGEPFACAVDCDGLRHCYRVRIYRHPGVTEGMFGAERPRHLDVCKYFG